MEWFVFKKFFHIPKTSGIFEKKKVSLLSVLDTAWIAVIKSYQGRKAET